MKLYALYKLNVSLKYRKFVLKNIQRYQYILKIITY